MNVHEQVTQAIAIAVGTDIDLATAAIDAIRKNADDRLEAMLDEYSNGGAGLTVDSATYHIIEAILGPTSVSAHNKPDCGMCGGSGKDPMGGQCSSCLGKILNTKPQIENDNGL